MSAVRVAIANDYEIVIAGIAGLLGPYEGRIEIVELVAGATPARDVDVILYDTFGQPQGEGMNLVELVADSDARVAVFSWNVQPELVELAIARGAKGYLSKSLGAEQIVSAIESIHAGETVTMPQEPADGEERGAWPGQGLGLTQRESEVLALITQGMTNQEIADRAYISINSVKTYVRTAYRKIGVQRRSQAVRWGMEHGFQPDQTRIVKDY